jgi:hypothetical protein
LVDDLLFFGDITRGVICQGIDVSMPDQTNVEADVLNAVESDLRTFLANLPGRGAAAGTVLQGFGLWP